jgi:hypothetical protein
MRSWQSRIYFVGEILERNIFQIKKICQKCDVVHTF